MISAILKWGLGNRMIQIAHIYLKAKINNLDYFFDDKYCYYIMHNINYHYKDNIFSKLNFIYNVYEDSPIFKYELIKPTHHDESPFNIEKLNEEVRLESIKTNYYKYQYCTYNEYIYRKIKTDTKLIIIRSTDLNKYKDNFITYDIDIIGFDFKYFYYYKKELYDLFVNQDVINKLKEKFKNKLSNSVSLHIRRTDYLISFPELIRTNDYYYNRIKMIEKDKTIENILIFSDDIQWCKENIKDYRITYIEGQEDYEDLYLMSLCENNIIIDSSFSWWASFFNQNENKIIIRPEFTIWT